MGRLLVQIGGGGGRKDGAAHNTKHKTVVSCAKPYLNSTTIEYDWPFWRKMNPFQLSAQL